jgi:hypothetical protein
MEYLTLQKRRCQDEVIPEAEFLTAQGKRVVIIGGGSIALNLAGFHQVISTHGE